MPSREMSGRPDRRLSDGNRLICSLRGGTLFGVRDQGVEARVAVERYKVGVFFQLPETDRIESVIHRFA